MEIISASASIRMKNPTLQDLRAASTRIANATKRVPLVFVKGKFESKTSGRLQSSWWKVEKWEQDGWFQVTMKRERHFVSIVAEYGRRSGDCCSLIAN